MPSLSQSPLSASTARPRTGLVARLATAIALAGKRVFLWPERELEARRDITLLAGMNEHELRDIGLTISDVASASALPMDADPTVFLARQVHEARAHRQR